MLVVLPLPPVSHLNNNLLPSRRSLPVSHYSTAPYPCPIAPSHTSLFLSPRCGLCPCPSNFRFSSIAWLIELGIRPRTEHIRCRSSCWTGWSWHTRGHGDHAYGKREVSCYGAIDLVHAKIIIQLWWGETEKTYSSSSAKWDWSNRWRATCIWILENMYLTLLSRNAPWF